MGSSYGGPDIWDVSASLSVVACICMLCHLRRAPVDVRHRLFWRQLVVLACIDLLQGASKTSFLLHVLSSIFGKASTHLPMFLDMMSYFAELAIAAGFLAASAGKPVDVLRVKVMLPCGILFNMGLTFVIWAQGSKSWDNPMYGWACLTYGFFTVALYFCGIARTLRGPFQIRCYASVRALSYMLSFALTELPMAALAVMLQNPNPPAIVTVLFNLSGASNAITYAFWVTRPRRSVQTTADIESSMIRHFFDLDVFDARDDAVFLARRATEVAVAEASELRRGMSAPEISAPTDP